MRWRWLTRGEGVLEDGDELGPGVLYGGGLELYESGLKDGPCAAVSALTVVSV